MELDMNSGEANHIFDTDAFPHFAVLLKDCEDYAQLSGFRFRKSSFDGIPIGADSGQRCVGPERARDSGPRLAAKMRSAAMVSSFSERLLTRDSDLMQEFHRAFQIVMAESMRNAMMGMFRALDMFPPERPPSAVLEDDCGYEDTSAPLEEIAQRLYNDEVRRICDSAGSSERRAKTSTFIVDFASSINVPLPDPPETQQHMLKELAERVAAVEAQQSNAKSSHARDVFLQSLGVGVAADRMRTKAKDFWSEHRGTALWGAAGAVALGFGGALLAVVAKKAIDRRRDREDL